MNESTISSEPLIGETTANAQKFKIPMCSAASRTLKLASASDCPHQVALSRELHSDSVFSGYCSTPLNPYIKLYSNGR
ncbi:hypothetical protein BVRB_2g035610 [Beta vulgaris subsp. vulgaris]|nr:hypothetical protein BVRB_2g035610 [Beta vulgaris subsp. vulgaris]